MTVRSADCTGSLDRLKTRLSSKPLLSLNTNKIVNNTGKTLWEWSVKHVDNVSDSEVQIHDRHCRAFQDTTGHTYLKEVTKQEPVLLRIKLFSFKPLGKHLLSKKKEGS